MAPSLWRSWLPAIGVSLLTSLLVILPFFRLGNASGHDFQFHAASWLDAAGQWKEGIAYPRWTEWANHGFGEPRFIFYPPLSWMLGAALSFVVPWNAVPAAFIALTQTIAGVCAFSLARRLLPKPAAVFGAVCYAANPYALLVVYMRSDFAEQLASAFFPLLVLFTLQIKGLPQAPGNSQRRATAFFSLVFAVIWLCNAPAGVLATYSSVVLFAAVAFFERSRRSVVQGAMGLLLGFSLTAFYLLPAAYEQQWVNIGQALSSGLLPTQNFLYTTINDPEHNLFNWIASSVAILLIGITGIAAISGHARTANRAGGESKRAWSVLLLLAGLASLLMLHSTSFLWANLPELRFVQFPWRWMAVLAIPYAYFLAAAFTHSRLRWTWVVMILAVSAGSAVFLVHHAWWDSEDIPSIQAAIRDGRGFDGTDEYDPRGDDHYDLPESAPVYHFLEAHDIDKNDTPPQAQAFVEKWTAENRELRVTAKKSVRLSLRLLNYPAWKVEVNGQAVAPGRLTEYGGMIVPLPAGKSHVRVYFTRTPDRVIGGILSVISALTTLLLLYGLGRRKLT